ncbi:hypothetical protein tb265_49790 [Gemmatimonadetes bacterium T265]|nr:hypothetical protein tb265_49790 [Gemmatimonadetes bacterium T265]
MPSPPPAPAPRASAPAAPLWVRGVGHRAAKRFTDGTHRCCAPEETFARIRPHFAAAGITRLADVSGLDRVGVTTVVAVRPNARSLSTAAGKGFTRAAATVSAAMEALECYHAEHVRLPTTVATYRELESAGATIPLDCLPLARRSLFRPTRPEAWLAGWDLVAQRDTWVPYHGVALVDPPAPRPPLARSFVQDSNGLASGNHLLEAACAALYELIERDAVACHRLAEFRTGYRAPLVALDAVESPLVQDLLARFRAVGLRATARDCAVDTDVPVYMAHLVDERDRNVGVFGGWGAHLDPDVALIRALTEAAQSRAVYVSGSRDDVFRCDERQARFDDTPAAVAALLAPGSDRDGAPGAIRPSGAGASFEADATTLVGRLRGVGVEQVILVDLGHEEFGIPVVKAIAPGLEGYTSHNYVAGRRAAAFCAAHPGGRSS